ENTVLGTDKARAWGGSDIPITYDPPVNDPAELKIEQQAQPEGPDLVRCWQQQAPALFDRLARAAATPAVLRRRELAANAAAAHPRQVCFLAGIRSTDGIPALRFDSEETLAFGALTGVRPMTEILPLERAPEGYERMISGQARFRVVL